MFQRPIVYVAAVGVNNKKSPECNAHWSRKESRGKTSGYTKCVSKVKPLHVFATYTWTPSVSLYYRNVHEQHVMLLNFSFAFIMVCGLKDFKWILHFNHIQDFAILHL